jgi:hypothetical protein
MMSEPAASGTCSTCGGGGAAATSSFVYALGRVEPRFPSLSVEKEFAQAVGRAQTAKLADRQAIHAVLTAAENAYLIRQLCWVFTIEGIDSYVVVPPGSEEARYLVEALRPSPREGDIDVVIGSIGPPVGGRACNGLMLPSVVLTQIYSFNVDELVAKLPRPKEVGEAAFKAAVQTLLQLTEKPWGPPRPPRDQLSRDARSRAACGCGAARPTQGIARGRGSAPVCALDQPPDQGSRPHLPPARDGRGPSAFSRASTRPSSSPSWVSKLAPYTER